jgi:hypothetical protein
VQWHGAAWYGVVVRTSCATTVVSDRSPASSDELRNVSCGFSIPPYGNAAGSTTISYCTAAQQQ